MRRQLVCVAATGRLHPTADDTDTHTHTHLIFEEKFVTHTYEVDCEYRNRSFQLFYTVGVDFLF